MKIISVNKPLAFLFVSLFLLVSQPTTTFATWSITAVDPKTEQVGIAGASRTNYVYGIAGVAPGKDVIVAQAMSNMDAKALGEKNIIKSWLPIEGLPKDTYVEAIYDDYEGFRILLMRKDGGFRNVENKLQR